MKEESGSRGRKRMEYVARFWLAWFLRKTSMMKNNNNKAINKANCTLKTKERRAVNRKVRLTSDSETKLLGKPRRLSSYRRVPCLKSSTCECHAAKKARLKTGPGTRVVKDHAAAVISKHQASRAD